MMNAVRWEAGEIALDRISDMRELGGTDRWDIQAVWRLEDDSIKKWIRAKALDATSVPDCTWQTVIVRRDQAMAELKKTYATPVSGVGRVNPEDLAAAEDHLLKKEAGGDHTSVIYLVLAFILMAVELVVFMIQFWSNSVTLGAAVVQAAILAVSGFVLGGGIGSRFSESYDPKRRFPVTFQIVVGSVLIVLMAIIRVMYSFNDWIELKDALTIAAVTVGLALLVALFRALGIIFSARYQDRWRRQFNSQVWLANKKHEKSVEYWESYFDERASMVVKIPIDVLERAGRKEAGAEVRS